MPSFAAQVTHGTVPGAITGLNLVEDEPDLTMQSVTRSATATKSPFRNNKGNTYALIYNDHVFTMALSADLVGDGTSPGALTAGSYATAYAGQALIATPNNWGVQGALLWFGHLYADGVTVIEEPSLEASNDVTEAPTFSCNLVNHPWIA